MSPIETVPCGPPMSDEEIAERTAEMRDENPEVVST